MSISLKEIFSREVILEINTSSEKNYILNLKEQQTKQVIEISPIPHDAILIKLDKYKCRSQYFNDSTKFINKACDYCLILPSDHVIFLIELKSKNPKEKDYIEQFVASELFINYSISLWEKLICTKVKFKVIKILFLEGKNIMNTKRDFFVKVCKNRCKEKTVIYCYGFTDNKPLKIPFDKLKELIK
jgi:hypothetical protein